MSSDSRGYTCRQAVRHILWASLAAPVLANAQSAAPAKADDSLEELVVTGYRASLAQSTDAKRESISFSDSIFAEDIGKFPDLNLAESLQRIPGVQIARDVTGEGTSVATRGLSRDFTQITLNGAPLETASDSNIDNVSQGRGVDLVLFPTELFSQLTVSKTPTAKQVEGGVAANVDLRIARPFAKKGLLFNYSAKASYQEASEEWSPRLGVFASNTWETGLGEIGVLGGIAYSNRSYRTDGFNTFAYTTVSLQNLPATLGTSRCPTSQAGCNTFNQTTGGYGNQSQTWLDTVPAGYNFGANGSTAGAPLTVCGPGSTPGGTSGLSCNQLSYSLWPRLARPDTLMGERETKSGILALQWAPSDSLSFYLDTLYSEADHSYERNDLNLAVRSTNTNVPVNVVLDQNNVVKKATIANPQWLNENRPYHEDTDFLNVNLGADWKIGEKLTVSPSFNYNHSYWFRSTNTYLFNSVLNSGITVDIENRGDGVYTITPSADLNNPNFWTWNALRIQPVEREVWQKGGRINLEYAFADQFKLGAGLSRDTFHRNITTWETTSCATDGGNANSPSGLECTAALTRAGIVNAKVAIPNAQLGSYMQSWTHGELYSGADFNVGFPNGWALPNYGKLNPAVNIDYFENQLARGLVGGINVANYTPRVVDEQTDALFLEANGRFDILNGLRYNAGVRYIKTDEFVTARGVGFNFPVFIHDYSELLPSFNVSQDLGHGVILRAAASRTMTRPAAGDIVPTEVLNTNGDNLTRGNPNLEPYFSKNFDLGAEWYFDDSGLGMVALNLWKKKITGFTSNFNSTVPFSTLGIDYFTLPVATQTGLTTSGQGNYLNAPVRVTQKGNTSELITLDGVELTYVQPLDILLKGAGLSFNYTRIKQSSSGGLSGAASSAIEGLSPYTYNVTAFYEDFGFTGRLSYSVRDAFVAFLGNNDQNVQGDNYAQKSGYLDASFGYKLPIETDVSISLELQNLTNESQRTYFRNDPATPRTAFAPGRQFLIGVSGKF